MGEIALLLGKGIVLQEVTSPFFLAEDAEVISLFFSISCSVEEIELSFCKGYRFSESNVPIFSRSGRGR